MILFLGAIVGYGIDEKPKGTHIEFNEEFKVILALKKKNKYCAV